MSNKSIILLIFMLLPFKNPLAQNIEIEKNIIGVWQENDSLVSSGLKNVYRFYSNGKFRFDVSSYNYLSRLISLSGKYKIRNNSLYLRVLEIKEAKGGEITYGDEADYNNWNYYNYKEKVITCNPAKDFSLRIKICAESKDVKCLRLNYLKFYKISSNPAAFQ